MIGSYITYPLLFMSALVCFALVVWYRLKRFKPVTYRYALTDMVHFAYPSAAWVVRVYMGMRMLILGMLIILLARPRFIETRRRLSVYGIDIMIALDVSGSMNYFDDVQDQRSRLEVAKQEAMRFIRKRDQDALGLVIFANGSLVRCPLTVDKQLLLSLVAGLELGVIDHRSTHLATALVTAAARLKQAKAPSKILIVLTDGEPTENDPVSLEQALAVLKKYGIKVYTIGIGSEEGGYAVHPWYGIVRIDTPLNQALLQRLADETGGKFFLASKPDDMRRIYDQIDALEKTRRDMPLIIQSHEWFKPLLWMSILLVFAELIISTFIWPLM